MRQSWPVTTLLLCSLSALSQGQKIRHDRNSRGRSSRAGTAEAAFAAVLSVNRDDVVGTFIPSEARPLRNERWSDRAVKAAIGCPGLSRPDESCSRGERRIGNQRWPMDGLTVSGPLAFPRCR